MSKDQKKTVGDLCREIESRTGLSGYQLAPLLGISGQNYYGKYRNSQKPPTTFQKHALELILLHGVGHLKRERRGTMMWFDEQPEYRPIDGRPFLSNYTRGGVRKVADYNASLSHLHHNYDTARLLDVPLGTFDTVSYSFNDVIERLAQLILDLWESEIKDAEMRCYDTIEDPGFIAWLDRKLAFWAEAYPEPDGFGKIIGFVILQLEEIHKYCEDNIQLYLRECQPITSFES